MRDLNDALFRRLFKEAHEKCFHYPLEIPLSETDSKLFSNTILENTGLVIGAKSLKNYSVYLLQTKEVKKENPSVATLDTLARYVLQAPYTDEAQRQNQEGHYLYWFQYKSKFSAPTPQKENLPINWKSSSMAVGILLLILAGFLVFRSWLPRKKNDSFTDHFNTVAEDSLRSSGWLVKTIEPTWWQRRNEKPGHLSLYTLTGDNWANNQHPAGIKNLVVREITADCFTLEIHLTNFFPQQNWQQAGILLSEDASFTGKVLRLSMSYNSYFGGYQKPPEIIIQALSSSESGNRSKPEEFAHIPLFTVTPHQEKLVRNNLSKSALKIEKKENHFRFLYTIGAMENFAFKEAVSKDFDINPKYIGLFASQGFANNNIIPARFDYFTFSSISCGE